MQMTRFWSAAKVLEKFLERLGLSRETAFS